MFRLELIFQSELDEEESVATRLTTQTLQLLTCASSSLPLWLSIPVDRYSDRDSCWVRSSTNYYSSGGVRFGEMWNRHTDVLQFFGTSHGAHAGHWRISSSQVQLWASLLRHWPPSKSGSRVVMALDYLVEAIRDLVGDERRAMLSASICLECLFGGDGAELRHRTSQRVAHLLGKGSAAAELYRRAKRWYDARSRFVHSGVTPDVALTVDAVKHLRQATTAMARLVELAGGHESALEILDRASFETPSELDALHRERSDAWWRINVDGGSG